LDTEKINYSSSPLFVLRGNNYTQLAGKKIVSKNEGPAEETPLCLLAEINARRRKYEY
jgi:hypothetical protein